MLFVVQWFPGSIFLGKGSTKFIKKPTPLVEEDYMKKSTSRLPPTDGKTTKLRCFNGNFSSNFSALWMRPSLFFVFWVFFIIGLHLFIGKYFWLPFSVFLSYKVLKRKSCPNFYKPGMGKKMLFECSCFCHCCCDVTRSWADSVVERPACSGMPVDLHMMNVCLPSCMDQT